MADLPAVAFAEELVVAYPAAKVVLVERDIERWYTSFNAGVIENVWSPVLRALAKLDVYFVGRLASTSGRWTEGWIGARSKREMQDKARDVYRRHYALVREVTPKERLLEFKLEEGWEPLCWFLDKPIPEVDFPNTNDSALLAERINSVISKGAWNAARFLVGASVPLVVGFLSWRMYYKE